VFQGYECDIPKSPCVSYEEGAGVGTERRVQRLHRVADRYSNLFLLTSTVSVCDRYSKCLWQVQLVPVTGSASAYNKYSKCLWQVQLVSVTSTACACDKLG